MNTQLIILAAGKGTRMNSEKPKVLVDLKGKPLIKHLLDRVSGFFSGIKPVVVVGYKREEVITELGEEYIYATQDEQLGTGHAASCGLEKATAENVVILYGDMPFISPTTLQRLSQTHTESESMFSMLTATPEVFDGPFQSLYTFGRIIRSATGEIQAIRELVDTNDSEKEMREVNPGIYLFNTAWLKENISSVTKNSHGEYYLTDVVAVAVSKNIAIQTVDVDPREVLGVNTLEQLEEASKLIE
jgi:bifunctional UDP-N-acetylglucosamine pyrophosphorylase/glucosamine-1-phosphate N-acetyltransferase